MCSDALTLHSTNIPMLATSCATAASTATADILANCCCAAAFVAAALVGILSRCDTPLLLLLLLLLWGYYRRSAAAVVAAALVGISSRRDTPLLLLLLLLLWGYHRDATLHCYCCCSCGDIIDAPLLSVMGRFSRGYVHGRYSIVTAASAVVVVHWILHERGIRSRCF